MKLGTARYAIYAACVAFLAAVLLWIFSISSIVTEEMRSITGLYLFLFGSEITAVASLLIGSLSRITLGSFEGSPDQIRRIITYSLRREGLLVEERLEDLKIKIDWYNSVRIVINRNDGATEVEAAPDLSTNGWIVAVLLIWSGFFGMAVVPLVLAGMSRNAMFADRRIAPLIRVQAGVGGEGTDIDVRAVLVDGLSESCRLSKDAYDAEKSNYQDKVILSFIFPLILWAVIVMVMVAWENNTVTEWSLVLATIATLSFALLSWFLIKRRAIPRLEKLKLWSESLENALKREIRGEIPRDGERSTFEILRDAYTEIPGWVTILRNSRAYREPVITLLVFSIGISGSYLLMGSLPSVIHGESMSYGPFMIGIALIIAVALVYRASKRKSDWELRRGQEELLRRIKLAERRMEEILSGEGDVSGDSSR